MNLKQKYLKIALSILVILSFIKCNEYKLNEDQVNFVKENFNKFYQESLQIEHSKMTGQFKILVRDEYVFRGQHISTIPLQYCLTPFHEYPHRDKVERILQNELRVHDQNTMQTTHFVFLILFLKSESNQDQSHSKFLNEYLNLEYINRASIVFWDEKKAIEQLQSKLYYIDVQYIQNIFKQIEDLIEITQSIIKSLELNESVYLNASDFDRSEIQKAIAFIKQNTLFLNYGQTIFNREEKVLPIIIPFFELFYLKMIHFDCMSYFRMKDILLIFEEFNSNLLIYSFGKNSTLFLQIKWLEQGPSNKQQLLSRLCKMDEYGNEHIKVNSEDQVVLLYSDCDFMKEEFFFIVPRHESSFEQFMNYGIVNENLDNDSITIRVNVTSIFQSEKQMKIVEALDLKNGIFKLKTGQLNYSLLKCFSLRHYFQLNKSNTLQLSDVKQIEKELSANEKYTHLGKLDYFKFLETLIDKRGQMSEDWKQFYSYRLKRYDSKERFEKSIRAIRFYQRRIIESHIKILQKYVMYISSVEDMKTFL